MGGGADASVFVSALANHKIKNKRLVSLDCMIAYSLCFSTTLLVDYKAQKYLLVPPSGDSGQPQIRVEEDDSLAGQRTHGLPNITGGNAGNTRNKDHGKDASVDIIF